MKNFVISALTAIILLGLNGCSTPKDYSKEASNPDVLHFAVDKLSETIVHDIFSPPVASRVYAYPSIAAYEVIAAADSNFISLQSQLKELKGLPEMDNSKEYCMELASLHAFLETSKALVFSEDMIESVMDTLYNHYRSIGVPNDIFENSIDYGTRVSDSVLKWADSDNYKQTRTFPKYTVTSNMGTWVPTPPAYMEGIEPHWDKIRTFVIDSAEQFVPKPPTPFDLNEESQFYRELMEVYEVGKNLDEEQQEIAAFWDCNPYVMNTVGHVMYATKKITPGGHWIGIVGLAARKAGSTFQESVEAYALTSIALFDGFISCWDEKYRSILIRPETVINEELDPDWLPYLQTPPFPEYTSGHSVISTSAAVMLTSIYGDNFQFNDSTEVIYGLPVRSFDSFMDASSEAAISRLYGGIHYMPAITEGVDQGKQVGKLIVSRLKTRP